MKVFEDIASYNLEGRPVVTIGNFDGVHLGHRKVFDTMRRIADESSSPAVVVTFRVHPRRVLYPETTLPSLLTLEERLDALSETGIDAVVLLDFNTEIAKIHATDFVHSIVVDSLKASHVVIGYDHAFGKNREGNIDSLLLLARHYGFSVTEVPPYIYGANPVSSSRIRELLSTGDVATAAHFLGRTYTVSGIIQKGFRRGGSLGFHTANIIPDNPEKLIPRDGVYASHVTLSDGERFNSITNIGTNPTFDVGVRTIETFIFDFHRDIYGEQIKVMFVDRIRDEMKFASAASLADQITNDIKTACEILECEK